MFSIFDVENLDTFISFNFEQPLNIDLNDLDLLVLKKGTSNFSKLLHILNILEKSADKAKSNFPKLFLLMNNNYKTYQINQ